MRYLDGCPECVSGAHRPDVVATASDAVAVTCWYQCSECGHRWWTAWRATLPVAPQSARDGGTLTEVPPGPPVAPGAAYGAPRGASRVGGAA